MIGLFASSAQLEGTCEVLPLDISDHFALLARMALEVPVPRRKPQATRPLYKVSWVDFNRDLQQAMQSFSVSDDIDQTVDSWYDIHFSVLNKHAPPSVAGKKAGRLPCPWLTDELVCLVLERNALHKQVVRNPGNGEIRSQHIRARRKAQQLDRRLRNEYTL